MKVFELLSLDDLVANLLPGGSKRVEAFRIQGTHLPRSLGHGLGAMLPHESLGSGFDRFVR